MTWLHRIAALVALCAFVWFVGLLVVAQTTEAIVPSDLVPALVEQGWTSNPADGCECVYSPWGRRFEVTP